MKVNEGTLDRILRVVIGMTLVGVGFWSKTWTGGFLVIIGWIPVLTGLIGWCPFYALFGFHSYRVKRS
ncbi:DUF2892 domain-containing protein [Leptospira fluminis]|uniref:DUF2892 domain-containing protein n=1 Tax=Leptospira fluminis TaxID=2484979 RepID=A0A4R9GR38_9LEPT|nr:DUF2892 domain-containing protein [Leptospira fluminis]TGK19302.1 DUF2892 domain-containing protein [Leptospira fluminis]